MSQKTELVLMKNRDELSYLILTLLVVLKLISDSSRDDSELNNIVLSK